MRNVLRFVLSDGQICVYISIFRYYSKMFDITLSFVILVTSSFHSRLISLFYLPYM